MSIHGYAGIYNPPLLNIQDTPDQTAMKNRRHSIFCVASDDRKVLLMIPLVPNFFETAFMIARLPQYQQIYLAMPALDMLFITDTYLLYSELRDLNKEVYIFSPNKPQIPVTDEFLAHVYSNSTYNAYSIGGSYEGGEVFHVEYLTDMVPMNRIASDFFVWTGTKKILFIMGMTEARFEQLSNSEVIENYDEIHMPFAKTLYGGINYLTTRRKGPIPLAQKLISYGFTNDKEIEAVLYSGGQIGQVIFNGLI